MTTTEQHMKEKGLCPTHWDLDADVLFSQGEGKVDGLGGKDEWALRSRDDSLWQNLSGPDDKPQSL